MTEPTAAETRHVVATGLDSPVAQVPVREAPKVDRSFSDK
jgi:hypothetical protein